MSPLLGTWQSIVLVDLNRDNSRRSVRLSFLEAEDPDRYCGSVGHTSADDHSDHKKDTNVQTHEIRKRFLDHFVNAGHAEVPSASVILNDPPNLLFVNAGMVQFVPFFLGQRTPPPWDRATSIQKCIRTPPDIDEVGITTRHNTFFQMAGNFSFGDYFKAGAIELAWTLLTNPVGQGGYGFDPERLWATVYLDDDEAAQLWQDIAGLPPERIQRRGMADNYWSMGIPGPCGPSSEIYYDRGGAEYGVEGGPEANEDRYIEIWNLVFMQNERGEGASKDDFEILGPLPRKNIDTGMGIERVACLLQGVDNVYETDLLRPAIEVIAAIAPRGYGKGYHDDDVRYRIIADHSRTAAIIIGGWGGQPPRQRGPRLRAAPPVAPHHPRRQAAGRRATHHGRSDGHCAGRDGPVVPGTGQ